MRESRIQNEEIGQDKEVLIRQLRLYQQVFDTMSSGVLVVGKDGDLELANEAARSLLRIDGDIKGKSLKAVLLSDFDIRTGEPLARNRSVARLRLRDGNVRAFGFSTRPIEPDGSLVVVFQDITVDVESRERKRRSEELALVGEMASRLSHEIRNPLASILMGVKTLQRDTPQSSPKGQILGLILEEVNSLTKIVSQLLDSARPRTQFPRPVYIEPLLERCLDAQGFQAIRRGAQLEIVRFSRSTAVLVDEQKMLRVLDILVQNALDACSKGDITRIGWRELDPVEKDELTPGFSGKVVSVFVGDNGSGIPAELSSSESGIFRAFTGTKNSGTGLGLTVARDTVEDHGGIILMDTLSNAGTRVQVLLPIPEGRSCRHWHRERSIECPSGKIDCESCDVRGGNGYFCWKIKEQAHYVATGQWPERCLQCGFFRASRLAPFFKSRLIRSKGR